VRRHRPENLIWVMPAEGYVDPLEGRAVVVFAGGLPPSPRAVAQVPEGAHVIAADSGYDHARAHGIEVDLLVGDLDSISPAALEEAKAAGIPIELHPTAKDATDLALALLEARDLGATQVTVIAGDGGRLDHLLTSVLALADPELATMQVDAWIGDAWVRALHGPGLARVRGKPGEVVTLAAIGGVAGGVRTEGLVYPLRGESLFPGSTRGVSNELEDTEAEVWVEDGTLLIVQPEALS
jgi:thiamine pyrophosphokinase